MRLAEVGILRALFSVLKNVFLLSDRSLLISSFTGYTEFKAHKFLL